MAEKTVKTAPINANGLALYEAIKTADAPITFAELARKAGVEAKTGYLTAARKLAAKDKKAIVLKDDAATVTVKTITIYADGTEIEKVAEKKVGAYVLMDAADAPEGE